MQRLLMVATVVLVCLFAVTSALAGVSSQSIPCNSGKYKGSTTGGSSLSFTVDCAKNVVTDLSFHFKAECLPDKHKESGSAEYDGNIPIKKKTYPNPEGGPRETVYFLAYSKKASKITAAGKDQGGTVLIRATTPPKGKVQGTISVDYSYGEDPTDPTLFKYNCGGNDGHTGPAKFSAHRA